MKGWFASAKRVHAPSHVQQWRGKYVIGRYGASLCGEAMDHHDQKAFADRKPITCVRCIRKLATQSRVQYSNFLKMTIGLQWRTHVGKKGGSSKEG